MVFWHDDHQTIVILIVFWHDDQQALVIPSVSSCFKVVFDLARISGIFEFSLCPQQPLKFKKLLLQEDLSKKDPNIL